MIARIHRWPQSEEAPPQPSGPPLDEGGDWWPMQLRIVGIVAAGAVALASTSALARSIHQQDEQIVPQPPIVGGGVLKERANLLRWPQVDEFQPEASTAIVEDYGWTAPPAPRQAPAREAFADDEALPAAFVQEFDAWQPPLVRSITLAPMVFAADEMVPQQPAAGIVDDLLGPPLAHPSPMLQVVVWAENEEIVPQPAAPISVDPEPWPPHLQRSYRSVFLWLGTTQDDYVPPPPVSIGVDADPWPPHLARSYEAPKADPAIANDQVIVPTPPPHEDYWQWPYSLRIEPVLWVPAQQEDLVPAPVPLNVDEAYWVQTYLLARPVQGVCCLGIDGDAPEVQQAAAVVHGLRARSLPRGPGRPRNVSTMRRR